MDWAGVRPSSGAAASDLPGALEDPKTSLLADLAAPGDGRTPLDFLPRVLDSLRPASYGRAE
jgi:hypothetical protein